MVGALLGEMTWQVCQILWQHEAVGSLIACEADVTGRPRRGVRGGGKSIGWGDEIGRRPRLVTTEGG